MIFNDEKKKTIVLYLLQKIDEKAPSLTAKVAQEFGITQNTVYTYLSELESTGIVRKVRRGEFELISQSWQKEFLRDRGDLRDENYVVPDIMKRLPSLPENVVRIWRYTLSEMINNVIDHSACNSLMITVETNALNSCVMLEDNGVGLFHKIMDYYHLENEEEVVCELFKGKLTTDKKNHSGEGIFFCSRAMDRFEVISGGYKYSMDQCGKALIDSSPQAGTIIVMAISNYSQKSLPEIFAQYADFEDGFVKTTIPLKNLFQGEMVSRSQAKRICERLEAFRTVRLDFAGVEWMGQGFADQIFRVFQGEHPEVEIVPLNMNDDIQRMYRHVLLRAKELER